MRFGLPLASLLCFTWMSSMDTAGIPAQSCCLHWSNKRVPLDKIKNYTIQTDSVCPITAVIFHTKRGNKICSSPGSTWTQEAMEKVDKKRKDLQMNIEESSSSGEPTESIALKGTVQKKRQRGRQRTGKKKIQSKKKKQRKSR
ncbi:eotaxin-like [Thalassophryne amazonica]|uniref:eotaxin-like n=1 Tax=Thalassophryne amazonica TaxID=390379 RepID=UPI0014710445|nr:eotaxin-like [Thalassophryne amazonica]